MTSPLYESALRHLRNLKPIRKEDIDTATRILDERYNECGSQGHLGPNQDEICQSCYRHYEYKSDIAERIAENRRSIPLLFRPIDAADIDRRIKQDIELQKRLDHFTGLRKILEQLEARSIS